MENNKGSVSDVIDATGELAASVVGLFLKINPELSQIVQQGTKDLVSEVSKLLGDSLDPTVHFLAERMTGDYSVDEFGFDPELTERVFLPILRVLYEKWFRVEVRGIENLPAKGACLLVANHSGTVALDSLMTQVAVHDAGHGDRPRGTRRGPGRFLRRRRCCPASAPGDALPGSRNPAGEADSQGSQRCLHRKGR